jgi:uncharacterized protein (DUF2236 family)
MDFKKHLANVADVLRKMATGKPTQDVPEAVADAPAPKPEAKPYSIMVRNAAGELVPKAVTAAEALEYCNRNSQWRRIG